MPLSLLFAAIALLYSAVGFGGGSSYIALLALYGYSYEVIPSLALICNLIVVSGGLVLFFKRGHFAPRLFWPFALSSIPFSFFGGLIPISNELFLLVLGVSLLLAGLKLLFIDRLKPCESHSLPSPFIALALGAGLGFLSGLVGIGGGIFLSPLLLLMRWGEPKQIAATAAAFIFVNSLAGLLGQIVKTGPETELWSYWPLFIAVFVGGQIGSRLSSGTRVSQKAIKMLTAGLVIFVGLRILFFA